MKSNKLGTLKKSLPPLSVTILILILIIIGISRYFFFNIEKDIYNQQMKELDEVTTACNWSLIEGTIREASLASQSTSLYVSTMIVDDIYNEYPDLNILKNELDNGLYHESKLPEIILKNIENKYLFNIRNKNNDIFVITSNGIAVDTNLDYIDTVYRSFKDEAETHFNYELAYKAFDKLLEHKNYNIIYYEPQAPDNVNEHELVVTSSYESLYKVYCKEGIEGLKGYTVLVPTYITDNGDIFGTLDINFNGKKVENHKMIVVQRFNIYDVLMYVHGKDIKANETRQESMKNRLVDNMQARTVTYAAIMILDLVGLMILVFYTAVLFKVNKIKQNKE